jgi:tRNA dimethylallyltransferase
LKEVRSLWPFRHLNSLNTVGYKELFAYLDGSWSLDKAVEKIKQHTRNYAKRQTTWFKNQAHYQSIPAENHQAITRYIKDRMHD